MAPRSFLHPYAKPVKEDFITVVRGEGSTIYDSSGKAYIDAMASLWYCQVGHGRAEIIDAVTTQMRALATYNTFDPWTNEPAEQVAEAIAQRAPMEDPRVFLTSSGSEAVDSAIKLARLAHHLGGRPEKEVIVSREHGYHGVTYGGLSAQGIPANQDGYGSLVPGVINTPSQDLEAVASVFADHGSTIAAVIAEPVQGAGGVHPPAPGYLEELRRLCDEHGAFLIFDDVICGFGRLGSWFGGEHYGVRPDLITFAKGVSSGYIPLGGVIVGPDVRARLESDPEYFLRHGHTYSGHPTACAAAVANIGVLEADGLVERAKQIGVLLGDGLRSLVADGMIAEARGEGALWAAGFEPGTDTYAIRDAMLAQGVVARPLTDAIAFCPPLVITDEEVARCVDSLAEATK